MFRLFKFAHLSLAGVMLLVLFFGSAQVAGAQVGRLICQEPHECTLVSNRNFNFTAESSGIFFENDGSFFRDQLLYQTGRIGIGVVQPQASLHIVAPTNLEGLRIMTSNYSPLNIMNSAGTTDIFRVDQSGVLAVGSVPWARLSSFPSACSAGQYVTGIGGTLSCATPTGGITGSGTTSYVARWTGASALGTGVLFDNGTNVGIGTTLPSYGRLSLQAASDAEAFGLAGWPLLKWNGGSVLHFGGYNASQWSQLAFHTSGTRKMTILSGGNVGIGTDSPLRLLDVAGAIRASNGQIHSPSSFSFLSDGNGAQAGRFGGLLIGTSYDTVPNSNEIRTSSNQNLTINARGTGILYLSTADSTKMTILNNGNTGVGTITPISRLNVESTVSDAIYLKGNTSGSSPYMAAYIIAESNADARGRGLFLPTTDASANNSWYAGVPYGGGGFQIGNSSSHARENASGPYNKEFAKLYINTSGNVGIGMTNPIYGLDIVSNTDYRHLRIGGAGIPLIKFANPNYNSGNGAELWQNNAGDFRINTNSSIVAFFSSASGNVNLANGALFAQQAGNVGVGLTNPATKLDVNGAIKTSRLGTYGTYNSSQVQGIWSISEGYPINVGSNNFGNQYGIGYAYSTNGGAPFTNVHQIVFTNNGTVNATIGMNGWAHFGGNVGIGITAPAQRLHSAGYVRGDSGFCIGTNCITDWPSGAVTSVSAGNSSLTISPTTGAVVASLNLANANTWTAAQTFNASTNFPGSGIWNASGHVGIGKTNPSARLHVARGDNHTLAWFEQESASTYNADVWIRGGGTAYDWLLSKRTANSTNDFWIYNNTDGTVLTLRAGGNVGIGTTAPTAKLHVVGAMTVSGGISGHASSASTATTATNLSGGSVSATTGLFTDYVRVGNNASGIYQTGDRLAVRTSSVDNVAQFADYGLYLLRTGQTYNLYLAGSMQLGYAEANPVISYGNGDLRFLYQSTERMRLNSVGNLGIGTTNPFVRLHVTGGRVAFGDSLNSNPAHVLGAERALNLVSTDAVMRIVRVAANIDTAAPSLEFGHATGSGSTEYTTFWDIFLNSGGMHFRHRATGASWHNSTRLTINNSGNVGIGLTNPTAKLHINGDLTVGSTGGGKINAGTVDPPYTINGKKYATYMASMTGVKEETAGVATLRPTPGGLYFSVLDLEAEEGSDLWLFSKTADLAHQGLNQVSVLLAPNFAGQAWYEKDDRRGLITIFASVDKKQALTTLRPEVSYRLTAPRFDYSEHPNRRADDDEIEGFNLDKLLLPASFLSRP